MKEQRKKCIPKYTPFLKDLSTQIEFLMKVSLKTFNKIFFFLRLDLYLQQNKILSLGVEEGGEEMLRANSTSKKQCCCFKITHPSEVSQSEVILSKPICFVFFSLL